MIFTTDSSAFLNSVDKVMYSAETSMQYAHNENIAAFQRQQEENAADPP